ncbi:DNA methyltransferase [Vandammella animalimorsus]|uniref:DNA methyltransferase n=1 Tax=Vandammella animalimorsus TaxID=2029117 RepID=A0A2A2T6B9_9BURK|nr:DNA adenine methylase [Vandammella animalimorsus]PAX17107.1 DNA methyltransferase [Vandammella animalimorsus]PAX19080.1 DNA methyltransferase [Vandammella animalimorsus]
MATLKNPSTTPDAERVARSVLRYFGGKWAIAPWVIAHLPAHRIYVEPFGGAAGVLLRKPRSRIEVYNDLDEEIVGLFRVLQDPRQCQRLIRLLRRTPYARCEFERAFVSSSDPLIRAQRAIVRAYQSFHHEALFNPRKTTFADARHRSGNHCKAHEWASYPRHLVQVCRRLQGVVIERRDALEVIRAQDTAETLFFVDPPYLPSTRSKAGYRHEMDEAQHVQLLERLRTIQGRAVVAGYPSELYDDLLSSWQRVQRPHRAAGSARARTEVLWISPVKR